MTAEVFHAATPGAEPSPGRGVARPGRPSIVHHIIAFLIHPENVATYQALDDAEPGPGYTCFGGPGGSGNRAAWIGGWAPGGEGTLFPQARASGCRQAPRLSFSSTTT
jgi:hypothetical protein